MSTAERMPAALETALSPVFPGAVFPHVYTGSLLRYVVWNYDELPRVFADSAPHASVYLVQAHLYLPHKESPTASIQAIRRALWEAGFTWPSLTDASDSEGQHWVLECQYTDGGGFYIPPPEPAPDPGTGTETPGENTGENDPEADEDPEDGET